MKGKNIIVLLCGLLLLNTLSCIKSNGPESVSHTPSPIGDCGSSPGPLFTAVKNIIVKNCTTCHNSNLANGGVNFSVDCNIVSKKDRIKVRAVEEASMPPDGPLSQSDQNKITAWIAAGGQYTN